MKWYDSFKYRPKHGTQIFIWDLQAQKQIMLNAFWDSDKWRGDIKFPFWGYVLDGLEPIEFQPERLNPETSKEDAKV